MSTTQTTVSELRPGDLAVIQASDGIRYTLLILTVMPDELSGLIRLDVAESVNGSNFGLTWDSRLAFKPADLIDKLEGIAA